MSLPENLILEQMELGPLDNFLYFIGDKNSNEIAVIDPAWDVPYLCQRIEAKKYKVVSVFLTHGHPDHVNGLPALLDKYDVPVYISKYEAGFLKPKHKNVVEIENYSKLNIGNIEFQCVLAPGHTPGCQLFIYKNVMIAGDVLFIDGCGRCDLPGGDPRKMYQSLYNIVMNFPDETVVFCGHNYGPVPYATIGEQKRTNPYLTCRNEREFLETRMGISI